MDLESLRDRIEEADRQILERLKERLDLAGTIASIKLRQALPFRDTAQEDRVLEHLRRLAGERGLDPHEVERLFRIILEMSVARQNAHVRSLDETPLRVVYQGIEGSYSHLAAQRRYAERAGGVLLTGCESFSAAAERVRKGEADYALLPIENTTAGSINETYDLLADGGLAIVGEILSRVEHCLLGVPGASIEGLRTVLSHPQALAQCRPFLQERLGHARIEPFSDTAGAARLVRERRDPTLGAIASEEAARYYGLAILVAGVHAEASNVTRFVEIARESEACAADRPIKSSLILELPHRPGALLEALRIFGDRRINLMKLESRPIPGKPFQYRFYLDVEGHSGIPPLSEAIAGLDRGGFAIRFLGAYPAAL